MGQNTAFRGNQRERADTNAFLLIRHAVDGEPGQNRQNNRKELQPKIFKHQIAQEGDHLARLVDVPETAAGESCLAISAGPGLGRSLKRKLDHRDQKFERAAGVTKTEVRKARSSSEVIPRTNCPL